MKLYFTRHGQSEANVLRVISNREPSPPLTDLGRVQAAQLAETLAGAGIRAIYSSPLTRARQTAEIVAARLELSVQISDALREFDCGMAEGKGDEVSWGLHNQVVQDWLQDGQFDRRIEGGESFNDMRRRFVPFVEKLIASPDTMAGSILLIGHGSLFGCMLPLVLRNVAAVFPSQFAFPNTGYVLAETTPRGLLCREWCGEKIHAP